MLQARLGDTTMGVGYHGITYCCPHVFSGTFIQGSFDTFTNGRPAVRLGDLTLHACPHCPNGMAMTGSIDVLINGRPAHRLGDMVNEFCGVGNTITGSFDTIVN